MTKINVHRKVLTLHLEMPLTITNVSDPFILKLDFLRENNFKLDFKNNELHSSSKDIVVFKRKYEDIKSVHQVTAKCETTILSRTESSSRDCSQK